MKFSLIIICMKSYTLRYHIEPIKLTSIIDRFGHYKNDHFIWFNLMPNIIFPIFYNYSLICSVGKEHACNSRPQFNSWFGKILWRRDRLPTPIFLSFPCGSAGKESACNAGHLDLIPGLGVIPWRKESLPTSVFWLREFHGLYSPWDHKELDMTM